MDNMFEVYIRREKEKTSTYQRQLEKRRSTQKSSAQQTTDSEPKTTEIEGSGSNGKVDINLIKQNALKGDLKAVLKSLDNFRIPYLQTKEGSKVIVTFAYEKKEYEYVFFEETSSVPPAETETETEAETETPKSPSRVEQQPTPPAQAESPTVPAQAEGSQNAENSAANNEAQVETVRLTEEEAIAQGYIVIKTFEDFKNIANNLGGKYILMADITMPTGSKDWNPLGDKEHPFTGVLNGNGYVLKNFSNYNQNPKGDTVGIFAYADGAEFSNLTLDEVWMHGSSIHTASAGALVGSAHNTSVHGVVVKAANVSGAMTAGGLIGTYTCDDSFDAENAITDCKVISAFTENGFVHHSQIYGQQDIGGLIGKVVLPRAGINLIDNCQVGAELERKCWILSSIFHGLGGIIGTVEPNGVGISNVTFGNASKDEHDNYSLIIYTSEEEPFVGLLIGNDRNNELNNYNNCSVRDFYNGKDYGYACSQNWHPYKEIGVNNSVDTTIDDSPEWKMSSPFDKDFVEKHFTSEEIELCFTLVDGKYEFDPIVPSYLELDECLNHYENRKSSTTLQEAREILNNIYNNESYKNRYIYEDVRSEDELSKFTEEEIEKYFITIDGKTYIKIPVEINGYTYSGDDLMRHGLRGLINDAAKKAEEATKKAEADARRASGDFNNIWEYYTREEVFPNKDSDGKGWLGGENDPVMFFSLYSGDWFNQLDYSGYAAARWNVRELSDKPFVQEAFQKAWRMAKESLDISKYYTKENDVWITYVDKYKEDFINALEKAILSMKDEVSKSSENYR